MTQRERNLLLVVLVLGGGLLLVGGVFAVQSISDGLEQHNLQVAALTKDNAAQQKKLQDLLHAQAKLEQWRAISLPAEAGVAGGRYKSFLKELCDRHQLRLRTPISEGGNLRSTSTRTSNLVTPLTYQIQADGTLARLIGFLKEYYALNLPHILRELTITPQGTGPDARLDIVMKIEVLSLPTATNRDFLLAVPDSRVLALDVFMAMKHGPIGLGLAPWLISPTGIHGSRKLAAHHNSERDYTKLIAKNVFVGLAVPTAASAADAPRGDRDVLKYIQLTGIAGDFLKTEATLRNRLTGKYTRLRAEGGWDSFTLKDGNDRDVLKGKVKHIEGRDVVFQVDSKHYRLHLGEFVDQALRKELTAEQLKALGVETEAPAENP